MKESTVEQWNEWRALDRNLKPDLSGLKFAELLHGNAASHKRSLIDLSGIDLRHANLRNADFTALNIDEADLSGADLRCATFRVTSAERAKFRVAKMQRVNVLSVGNSEPDSDDPNATIPELTVLTAPVTVTELELRGASFREADFTGTSLSGANLGAADLTDAILRLSQSEKASMQSVAMIRTDIEAAGIWHARMFPPTDERDWTGWLFQHRTIKRVGEMMASLETHKSSVPDVDLFRDRSVYYRGEKDHRFELIPSVMRNQALAAAEDQMLTELSIKRTHEIDERQLYFQRLVMARHFELPTRLLDVTRNPLVALYYASEVNDDATDGVVHLFIVDDESIKPYDSDTISLISNFTRLQGWEKRRFSRIITGSRALQDPITWCRRSRVHTPHL